MPKSRKRVKKGQPAKSFGKPTVKYPSPSTEDKSGGKIISEAQLYSGPIPPPIELERYGQVNSSFPERIIKMAEKEQEHQHNQEKTYLAMRVTRFLQGQWMGFILSLVLIIAGSWLIYSEKIAWGVVWGSSGILIILFKIIISMSEFITKGKQSSE